MLGPFGAFVTSDPAELSKVIGDIYDAAMEPTLWQRALGSICQFVGGSSAALFWHDSATQRSEALYLFNEDAHYTQLYFEKYMPMNPVFPAATFMEAGVVHTTNDIIPQDELEKTQFYKEWIEPQGIVDAIAVNLEKGTMRSSLLNIRTDKNIGMADKCMRQRLELLVPHVQRAVAIGRLFDQGEAKRDALTQTLDHVEAAVVLVGADGTIVHANDPATRMLAEGKLIAQENGRLRALSREDGVLHNAFASAAKGDSSVGVQGVAVPLLDGAQQRWLAHVLPLTSGKRKEAGATYDAVAAVFIRKSPVETPPTLETLAKAHKLTATEVRVLACMLKANGVKAMAEMLGLSQATVKTHLHNLFRKTGTRRQSDLVKLLAGI